MGTIAEMLAVDAAAEVASGALARSLAAVARTLAIALAIKH